MKSDVITISNDGTGMEEALAQAEKVAQAEKILRVLLQVAAATVELAALAVMEATEAMAEMGQTALFSFTIKG
jgi:hypothetical protein